MKMVSIEHGTFNLHLLPGDSVILVVRRLFWCPFLARLEVTVGEGPTARSPVATYKRLVATANLISESIKENLT